MKNNKAQNKVFSFHSTFSPCDFVEKIKTTAMKSNKELELKENGFHLIISGNHGGKIVYEAKISEDENGCSFISGEIKTIPWNRTPNKEKNLFQKVLSILGFILISPLILVCVLCVGIYMLFVRLFCGKNSEPTKEEILYDFMIRKMNCEQKKT